MANFKVGRKGFAQVEPNHMIMDRINAQLPVDAAMGNVIENGRFAKYDYATGKVNLTGAGEWMMIYNEEKLYDERKQSHKDFAMVKTNYTDGEMVPRLIGTELGDIFTTNAFGANTSDSADVNGLTFDDSKVNTLAVDKTTGYLVLDTNTNADANGPKFQIAKYYTMADGQPGVKVIRIQ